MTQKVVASFMPATLETIKSEEKQTYHYPLKTNYREHIHSPEGVNGLVEHSMLMDMLNKTDADGHECCRRRGGVNDYVLLHSWRQQVQREIETHAQYVLNQVHSF